MSQTKSNIALGIAAAALALSLYNQVFTQSQSRSEPAIAVLQDSAHHVSNTDALSKAQISQSHLDLGAMDKNALIERIEYLEERILDIENRAFSSTPSVDGMEEVILAVLEEKERKDKAQNREDNPVYGFYEDLPKDYDLKLKTDPEFAMKVSQDLRSKVLDESLSPTERLSAMGQLQMNMYILNRTQGEMFDYETVDAVLEISRNSQDEKLKVQALEVVAHTPVVDTRIAKSLQDIIEKEPNKYMKTMAAEGLIGQYYQSGESSPELKQQLASDILDLYNNSNSSEAQLVMQRLISDDELLEQIRRDAGR
ncbi:hypothetical protein A7985_12095 [Pseudoalteromonas luteoviolacea]|uniref:Uncharacterized protein n=1 Tax=Pseudoalteromonas luteoviolacea TaxID=43657 RepID=A0A1C0TQY9_9GAMM|nr:hypothetical protein [Pseudoalteromonas luteoviolacea]OCQ21354.1 hypothetical protein A7985_12095 [Pseudoalteromonas luteoviolacea]